MKIYTIRDQKGETFNTPFFQKTHGEAERSFKTLVNDGKSLVSQYPDDFDLYHLGDFAEESGIIKPLDTPQHIAKAVNMKPSSTVEAIN